jgi:hypothetical protein
LQCDKKIFKDPLQELPAYEIVFVHKKLSMLFAASREWKPWELLRAEFLQQSNSGKRLKTVEFNELKDFLVEYFKEVLDYNFTASVEKEFDEKKILGQIK